MVINQQLSRVSGRKAIVLFTDGVDTTSRRADYQSNIMDAQELDALIYPVQYDTAHRHERRVTYLSAGLMSSDRFWVASLAVGDAVEAVVEVHAVRARGDYELANQYLLELANSTGGREYRADSLQNMSYRVCERR